MHLHCTDPLPSWESIRQQLAACPHWQQRYRELLDLGKQLPTLPDNLRTEAHRVPGCEAQVWLVIEAEQCRVDADSALLRGLLVVLLAAWQSGQLQALDQLGSLFAELELQRHLSPSRANGLRNLAARLLDPR